MSIIKLADVVYACARQLIQAYRMMYINSAWYANEWQRANDCSATSARGTARTCLSVSGDSFPNRPTPVFTVDCGTISGDEALS